MCAALVGCASDQYPVIFLENHTDSVVDVYMVRVGEFDFSSRSPIVRDIDPGSSYPWSNIAEGCTDVQLVALDQRGAEIARSPTPVCRPSTWVIDD